MNEKLKPWLACLAVLSTMSDLTASDPEKSVIQISTFSQQPIWDAPWRMEGVRRSSGSGFVIKGKRIMTNAHVVSWARQLYVKRYQDPRPYPAKVSFIAHDADLAILEVDAPDFFTGLEPLEIGTLPKVRSTVVTYGYPAGGEQISYTRGVVSRIELQSYVHIGNRAWLAVQTDAAINPGNSGGPVIQDDKVVGVSFQGAAGLENAGFFIPPPVIQHMLRDIEDGKYDGFPTAGVRMAPLQNPSMRQYLKLPDNDVGVRIDYIGPVQATSELIHEDDTILQVGTHSIANDGTVIYEGNRLQAGAVFSEVQSGESVPLKIWREGKEMEIQLPMTCQTNDKAEGNQYSPAILFHLWRTRLHSLMP